MPLTRSPDQALPPATAQPDRDRLRVWRYLRALGACASEADDLAQETMLASLRSERPSAAPDGAAGHGVAGHGADRASADAIVDPDAFRLGIARNLWLRSRRWWQRRREREIADAAHELWTATAADDDGDELIERLRRCLEQLQPRARTALDLHYRDGLKWHEIGPRVGLGPNGTKTLAQRTRQALRACIERREP